MIFLTCYEILYYYHALIHVTYINNCIFLFSIWILIYKIWSHSTCHIYLFIHCAFYIFKCYFTKWWICILFIWFLSGWIKKTLVVWWQYEKIVGIEISVLIFSTIHCCSKDICTYMQTSSTFCPRNAADKRMVR